MLKHDNSGHLRGAQDLARIAVVSCQLLESDLGGSLHQTHLLPPCRKSDEALTGDYLAQ